MSKALHTIHHLAEVYDIPVVVRRSAVLTPAETGRLGNLALFVVRLPDPEVEDGVAEVELTGAQLKAFAAGMQLGLGRWPNRLRWTFPDRTSEAA